MRADEACASMTIAYSYPMNDHPEIAADPNVMTGIPGIRGMPHWRDKQRSLPMAEKVDRIGKFITETRQLEIIKKSCTRSAMSWSNYSKKEP